MTKKILITVKNVYGNLMIYPVCKDAQTFAKMLGTKTLTNYALSQIEALGYEIEQIAQPVSWKKAA